MAAILLNWTARERWLQACAVVAEAGVGARVPKTSCAVAYALHDGRVAVLGGRPDMPLSLGSVYAGSVARFLGGPFRCVPHRSDLLSRQDRDLVMQSVALDASGAVLVVLYSSRGAHAWTLETFDAATATPLRRLVSPCPGSASDVCVAPDGSVFVGAASGIYAFPPGLTLAQSRFFTSVVDGVEHVAATEDAVFALSACHGYIHMFNRDSLRWWSVPLFYSRTRPQKLCVLPHEDGVVDRVAVIQPLEERVIILRIADGIMLSRVHCVVKPLRRITPYMSVGSFTIGTATVFVAMPYEDCSVQSLALSPIGELYVFDCGLQRIRVYT